MSLRRLYLCFCDLFDLLENCIETIDSTKKKSILSQIEPTVALIKTTVCEIQAHYEVILECEGIHFSYDQVLLGLDEFVSVVRKERDLMNDIKPSAQHPNILILMTSGLAYAEVKESLDRYIPRSDVFPCDLQPNSTPSFTRKAASGDYLSPQGDNLNDASLFDDDDVFGLELEREPSPPTTGSSPMRVMNDRTAARDLSRTLDHLPSPRPSSPSIGRPVRFANIAHFAQHSLFLVNHYNAAGGECPGRATILTGQLPPVHGVRTSLEKTGGCSELKADGVPTLGHYLSQAGYDVVFKGEWGLSDVQALREHPLLDLLGVERDADEDLQPFGFQGWEAHREGDWYSRILETTGEAVEYVRRRQHVMSSESLRGSQPPPWALVVSYPDLMSNLSDAPDADATPSPLDNDREGLDRCTDRSLSGQFSMSCGNLRNMDSVRSVEQLSPDSDNKQPERSAPPCVQKLFMDHCRRCGDVSLQERYEENARHLDMVVGQLLQEVLRSGSQDTVVVLTSACGNLAGEHAMWGSCYNAFEDSIRVPCIFYLPPRLPPTQRISPITSSMITSSVDLLPTLLHVAGVDVHDVQQQLTLTHSKVLPLRGQDLCHVTTSFKEGPWTVVEAAYYQSEDVSMPLPRTISFSVLTSAGDSPISWTPHRSVAATVARVRLEKEMHTVKLCYYSSDPRTCSDLGHTEVQTAVCEWELFDLTTDPKERTNLCSDVRHKPLFIFMKDVLSRKHNQYCEVISESKHQKQQDVKRLSLLSFKFLFPKKEVKWQQFYFLAIALAVSIIAILLRLFLS